MAVIFTDTHNRHSVRTAKALRHEAYLGSLSSADTSLHVRAFITARRLTVYLHPGTAIVRRESPDWIREERSARKFCRQ